MKKIFSIIIILFMFFSMAGCNSDEFTTSKVKWYTEKGVCPVCNEPLVKYCFGSCSNHPYFVWSCPNGCEDE